MLAMRSVAVASDCVTFCEQPENDAQAEARILFNLPDNAIRDVNILGKVAEVLSEHYAAAASNAKAVSALIAIGRIASDFMAGV